MIDLSSKCDVGPVIRPHPDDNAVVARVDVSIGMPIPGEIFPAAVGRLPGTRLLRGPSPRANRFANTTS